MGDVWRLIMELRNGISTKPNPEPPGHPILRISATRPGRVLLDDVRYLSESDDLVGMYCLRDGDLLFTRYNGSLDLLGVCPTGQTCPNGSVNPPCRCVP